jgi:hypothetical protein
MISQRLQTITLPEVVSRQEMPEKDAQRAINYKILSLFVQMGVRSGKRWQSSWFIKDTCMMKSKQF